MNKLALIVLLFIYIYADEPISPIPLKNNINTEKAKLGQLLFCDPILSQDNSTACVSCHDIYGGGADSRAVSIGFAGREGNIHAPSVLNAKYNFKQFWNGRAENLLEQANEPINNPLEHAMNFHSIEQRMNASPMYKEKFQKVYHVSFISYRLVLDAIVEFENALTTPNAKFDKFLRHEIKLDKEEEEGYILFKQYGCITCHNGVNIGGNSFQKMGTFLEYTSKKEYPDRSKVTHDKNHKNVFKVPTLRNITLSAPYFHDASKQTLKEAIIAMSEHNLGIKLSDQEIEKIIAFLHTLEGERPHILDIK